MMEVQAERYCEIDVERIVVNPFQPRKIFPREEIEELAASIQHVGLLHPPIVRPSSLIPGFFEIIAGERRFRAWQHLGRSRIPVLVRNTNDTSTAQIALVENIQRSDLNPIEIAKAFEMLVKKERWTQEELADRMGKKRSSIANYLRLLRLSSVCLKGIREKEITMGHAKVLLSLNSHEQQEHLLAKIVKKQWSVRQAERWVSQKRKRKTMKDIYIADLEQRLENAWGTSVAIRQKGKKGTLSVDFYGNDDLHRLLVLLGVDREE